MAEREKTSTFAWSWRGRPVPVGYDVLGHVRLASNRRQPALLLPALSTVSTRAEMAPLARALDGGRRLILADWPGFGDAPRPALDYDRGLCQAFLDALVSHLQERFGGAPPAVIAAGHATGYALALAARKAGAFERLVLIAPTWRGPLPTMMAGRRPLQARIKRLVHAPLVGPLLYRLNVSRPVVRMMYKGHVFAGTEILSKAFLDQKMRVARAENARFASASFVTGALDPFDDRAAFLAAARAVQAPILMLYGENTPPRSRAEMEALAALPGVSSRLLPQGALGIAEEFSDTLAPPIREFLG